VTFADKADPRSGPVTLSLAEANLVLAGSATQIAEAVMDKGYHDNGLLVALAKRGVRTYIPNDDKKSGVGRRSRRHRKRISGQPSAGARGQRPPVESLAQ